MEEKEIDKSKQKELKKILQEGEEQGILKRRQKVDYTKFRRHGVYNRKFARNWLKKQMGTNKIRDTWHQLKMEGKIGA